MTRAKSSGVVFAGTVCGQRHVTIRLVTRSGGGRYTLRITTP